MKTEIRRLRESIADGGGTSTSTSGDGRRRRRRGGRGGERGREAPAEKDGNGERERRQERRSLPKEPPEDAPVGLLVDHLSERGVTVFEGSDDLNRNEAFEHLARHLGTHFEVLQPFYERMKRTVATGRGSRIDIEHFSSKERSAAVQFGTLLHRHGMLKDFYYHRSPKKSCRVIPTKDGTVGQFLTGGWLEIFVSLVLARRLKSNVSPSKYQMLYNVKGRLPDGREFEADLMAYVDGRLFWLECKTGNWQDYAARFKGLVKIFGVDRESAGLLLIRPPDESTRGRATDMLDMTLLSLSDVDDFISQFLGVESEGDDSTQEATAAREAREAERSGSGDADGSRADRDGESDGEADGEDGASTGGRDGEGADDQERARRRRRRRRRGGRGRGRRGGGGGGGRTAQAEGEAGDSGVSGEKGASGESGADAGERDRQKSLHEPVPIQPLEEDEEPKRQEAAVSADSEATSKSNTEADEDREGASETEPREARSARPSPFAADAKADGEGEESSRRRGGSRRRGRRPAAAEVKPADAEPAAEKAPAAKKAAEEPKKSAEEPRKDGESATSRTARKDSPTGVTIQPDLAAMMAGTPKKKDED